MGGEAGVVHTHPESHLLPTGFKALRVEREDAGVVHTTTPIHLPSGFKALKSGGEDAGGSHPARIPCPTGFKAIKSGRGRAKCGAHNPPETTLVPTGFWH
ncbi:hypothetical protein AVEN_89466-1 [Araneus ventricosus]|uniref:Uncharacterized protein n=1 Tax=Araneus ventricosus TaxID=182803 RepID=A0A4Y2TLR1_ARAVE|nr:hypothetical protein AVEN_89466-1 [Araneus ventricosus]